MADQVKRTIPNLLTAARVVLAITFFVVISVALWPRLDGLDGATRTIWGNIAVAVFVVAAFTDFADGFLARRWQVVSVFGRVMDPFSDKLLVIGAFVLLASPAFLQIVPDTSGGLTVDLDDSGRVVSTSGVRPWMVLVILGRELLVTSIRGFLEGRGIDCSAGWSGKGKMILQSIAIPVALFVAVNPFALESEICVFFRDKLVLLTVLVTLWSAIPYLRRMRDLGAGGDTA